MGGKSIHYDPDSAPRTGAETPLLDYARARRTDPVTSAEAARRMNRGGAAARHEGAILSVLRSRDELTGKEIGERAGLTNVQVLRRMKSLEERGLVARGDKRDRQLTWLITERGRAA